MLKLQNHFHRFFCSFLWHLPTKIQLRAFKDKVEFILCGQSVSIIQQLSPFSGIAGTIRTSDHNYGLRIASSCPKTLRSVDARIRINSCLLLNENVGCWSFAPPVTSFWLLLSIILFNLNFITCQKQLYFNVLYYV